MTFNTSTVAYVGAMGVVLAMAFGWIGNPKIGFSLAGGLLAVGIFTAPKDATAASA